MKKIFLVGVFLLVFFLTSGIASAHRVSFGFGFFPPVIVIHPRQSWFHRPLTTHIPPIPRILTVITVLVITVIVCGCRAIGVLYGLIAVGRESGLQDTGNTVPKGGSSPY